MHVQFHSTCTSVVEKKEGLEARECPAQRTVTCLPADHQAKHGNLRLDKTFNFCRSFVVFTCRNHLISLLTADLCSVQLVAFRFYRLFILKTQTM